MAILDALRDGPMCVKGVVKETGLSQSNVSNHLGRLRTLGWVMGEREGRQVLYRITDYFVEQFVRSQERPGAPLGARARRRIARELLPAIVDALIRGAGIEARDLVHDAMLRGLSWQDLYLLVFTPALQEVGERWESGAIRVCDEHMASACVERLMARVYPGAIPPLGAPTVVVACVEGNLHTIGPRMVADFFAAAGWRVRYLGANMPTPDLALASRGADAVALSASQADQLPAIREAAAAIRGNPAPSRTTEGAKTNGNGHNGDRSSRTPLILAGGRAVTGQEAVALGVDLVDRHLPRTLRLVERWQSERGRSWRREGADQEPAAFRPSNPRG
jgi:methanogenic corrinoid protein MtbC1